MGVRMCYPLKIIIKGYFCRSNFSCSEVGSYISDAFLAVLPEAIRQKSTTICPRRNEQWSLHILKTENENIYVHDLQRKCLRNGEIISRSLLHGILMKGMAFLISYLPGCTHKYHH